MSYEREQPSSDVSRPDSGSRRPPIAADRAARQLSARRKPGAGDFAPLAQAIGNRRASRLLQRQTSRVTGQFLRVRIVGHASARWRSARTADSASARNRALSEKRAAVVKEIVLRQLAGKVPVPIDVDVSIMDDDDATVVTVGSHGEGSRAALERSGGDRSADEQRDRRVDIEAELATTERRTDRTRVRRSAVTRDWLFTITRYTDFALGFKRAKFAKRFFRRLRLGPGFARVELEIEIKNPLSGKVATGSARLEGGGTGGIGPDKGGLGRPDIPLRTDRPVGFKDFDGSLIRVEQPNIKLGYGVSLPFIVFGGLRKNPVLIQSKRGWGLPGGYIVVGDLRLHNIPDDYWETDEQTPPYKRRSGEGQGISVMFDTGSAAISESDARRIQDFSDNWAARFH
jgi:hypothetical protein